MCHDHRQNACKGCLGVAFCADDVACHVINTGLIEPQISCFRWNQLLTGIMSIICLVNMYISGRIQSSKW